jgi:hypothetical protein
MKSAAALIGSLFATIAVAVSAVPALAQFRQVRNETETRQCQTSGGLFSTRIPSYDRRRLTQTRTCHVELRCPGTDRLRACFQVRRQCDPWPGICSSR